MSRFAAFLASTPGRRIIAIVGIDIGTQSLKAVVTDDDLAPLGSAAIAYQPDYPRPGWAEIPPRLEGAGFKPALLLSGLTNGIRPQICP